jgi:hypothetical protein
MAMQTRLRLAERPLNVVLRPNSPAESAYRSAVLSPGFEAQPGLDLRYLGGKTIPHLTFTNVYLGDWDAGARAQLDHALAAAMSDAHLNNVLAQYFKGTTVTSTFAGSRLHDGGVPRHMYRDTVASLVGELDEAGALEAVDLGSSVVCLLLPRGAVLVDGDSHGGHAEREDLDDDAADSKHGLAGYHGSVHVVRNRRLKETDLLRRRGLFGGRQWDRRLFPSVAKRLRDALPRADRGAHQPGRRGRDPCGRYAGCGASTRLVLVARRRDRRHPDDRVRRRPFARDAGGAARRRQRQGADPADVVERGRRPGGPDRPSAPWEGEAQRLFQ